jgi:hypothetical protein
MSVDFGSEEADKVLVGIEIELSEYIQRIMTEKGYQSPQIKQNDRT